jgi:hypothetical protein
LSNSSAAVTASEISPSTHADPHNGRVNRFWTYDDACERFALLEEDGHRCVLVRVTPERGRRTIAPGLSYDPAA